MFTSSLNLLLSREREREFRQAATERRGRRLSSSHTPVTRVTLRYASVADSARLRQLAELDSGRAPSGAALVAEVDGRLRAALPLEGGPGLADPFFGGCELLELLRVRAAQLTH